MPTLQSLGVDVTDYCPAVSNGARLPGPLRNIRRRYLPPVMIAQALLNVAMRTGGVLGSYRADITWLERNFAPGLDDLAAVLKRPLVVDVDDAIWLYNPFGASVIKRLVGRADMVLAGNNFLADWSAQYCKDVRVVATAIDVDRFCPPAADVSESESPQFVVGWTGTSGNFRFLLDIQQALATFLKETPQATFLVVADERPELPLLPQAQLKFVQWTPAIEHEILRTMDVGIMPIDDSDLSRGKCSFKMLQYMATGLPVIVSPYGMNAEILREAEVGFGCASNEEWLDAFRELHRNKMLRQRFGAAGRALAESSFSTVSIATKIASAFKSF
jgi:glycosyltransferase involved in cell wall biosynthesis